jgi:diacylglycerol kinase (ATP)
MRCLLLHNPSSGDGAPKAEELTNALVRAGYETWYCRKGDKAEFARRLAEEPDLVAVAGGDGTVGSLLGYLPSVRMPVLILPSGTSNNIAQSLGLGLDPIAIIEGLDEADEGRLDVGVAAGPWGQRLFLESVGIGLFAETMSLRVDGNTRDERIGEAREAIAKLLPEAKARKAELDVDGEAIEEAVLLAEVTNIRRAGPALVIAADADPGDGQLDVVWVPSDHREAMIHWLRHQDGPAPVLVRRGRLVKVRSRHPVRIDDSPMGKVKGELAATIGSAALRVLVPRIAR